MTLKQLKSILGTSKKITIEDDFFNELYTGYIDNAPKKLDHMTVDEINVDDTILIVLIEM